MLTELPLSGESSGPRAEGVPTNNHIVQRSGEGGLNKARHIVNRCVSQSAMLQKKSAQCCRRAKHYTYFSLVYHDQWAILSTSNSFYYF